MKMLHIASFSGQSGISKYANNFFDLILKPRGYEKLDSKLCNSTAIKGIKLDYAVHVEIGVNETAAIRTLYQLIDGGHRNVSVTLHDPPFISWPYYQFRSQRLNEFSKFIHLYLRNFKIGDGYFKSINKIFVLTHAGVRKTESRYRLTNVFYLPHLIIPGAPNLSMLPTPPNLIFFGYIAKNKRLDYALKLHERLLDFVPQCKFFVVGSEVDNVSSKYLRELKSRYKSNVEYLGFVEDVRLQEIFSLASIAVMPFEPYKSIIPASGSVLSAMAAGKIVCATPVNAIPEFILDGKTGVLLRGDLAVDTERIRTLLTSHGGVNKISRNAVEFLRLGHGVIPVGCAFDNPNRS